MILTLQRKSTDSIATAGELYIDGEFCCYTLERPSVQIAPGTYYIEMTYSPHFLRDLPLLDGVPGRSAIRIHPGNQSLDSDGCILVGYSQSGDMISQSRAASDDLNVKIASAIEDTKTVAIVISPVT